MRKLLMTITILSASLFAAANAQAARWTCEGPEFVCGSSSSNSAEASEPKAKRAARVANTDNDDQPVARKARHQAVANNNDDGDQPVRRRKARSYDNDNDGGGSSFSGKASYYWEPQALASGGRFNPNAYTAAHKTLPFGTRVRVTNQNNGQSVDVVINDRGPYVAGRVIDLSKAAAHSINMQGSGVAPVTVRVLGRG
jgi:rare lipoprotein A